MIDRPVNGAQRLDASYLSHEAANAIVSSYEGLTYPDDPAVVWIDGGVLASVNQFLDFVLREVLGAAQSASSLALLKTAIRKVVPSRLADESILEAEAELASYADEFDLDEGSVSKGGFDLDQVFEGMRIKCMVYSQLGNVEEGSVAADAVGVDPACAIFMVAAMEFMGEHSLLVAARRAQGRTSVRGRSMTYAVTRADLKAALVEDEQFKEVWRRWLRSSENKAVSFRDHTSPFLEDSSEELRKLAPENLVDRSAHKRMSAAGNGFSVRSRPQSMIEDLRSSRVLTPTSAEKRRGVVMDELMGHARTVSNTSDDAMSQQSFTIMYPQRESLRTLRVHIPPSDDLPPTTNVRSPDRQVSRPSSSLSTSTPPRTPTRISTDGVARRRSSSSSLSEAYRKQAQQKPTNAQRRRSLSNTPTKSSFEEARPETVPPVSGLATSAPVFPAVSPIPEHQGSPNVASVKQPAQSTSVERSASTKSSAGSPKEKLKSIFRASSASPDRSQSSKHQNKVSGLGIDMSDGDEVIEQRLKFDNLMSTGETVKVSLTPQTVRPVVSVSITTYTN